MCDESWEDDNKFVKHYVDEKNFNDFAERGDYTFISGTEPPFISLPVPTIVSTEPTGMILSLAFGSSILR